jgi:lysine/ornithine N-monooxygenase
MSEEVVNITPDSPVPEPEVVAPGGFNIHAAVKEAVAASTAGIKDKVVNLFVEKELKKLEDAVLKAIADLDTARQEVRKIKPDVETFDADGKVVTTGYHKATLETIKKAKEKVAKLDAAVQAALVDNDYSKVLKLGN